jgi:hypothetical protein
MKARKVSYQGWQNCYRLANNEIELIVTGDVGPRVIHLGFIGGTNVFKEYAPMMGKTGGKTWRIYGGHRLWHAPEGDPRSYSPDNTPVEVTQSGKVLQVVQPTEKATGIQKELDIHRCEKRNHVRIVHRLRNHNQWAVELAPWALSVMAQGGTAIVPQPPRGSHPKDLLPVNTLTLWAYTNLSDPRWTWGNKYFLLRQDSQATKPQKIGASVPDGWAAYANAGNLFVKRFTYLPGARYADLGCNFETFTNEEMLEVETLGPLVSLAPGAAVEHEENWFLFRDVPTPRHDADVDRHVLPLVRAAKV